MPEHQREITERVRGATPDVAHQIIEEEIRPVVRESITADTLKAIADMVALTPSAVDALREDLGSEDAVIRQRAYTLLMKYTVGHHAIVTPEEKDKGGPMTVNFHLPRPEDGTGTPEQIEADAVVLKTCDTCELEKPESEFIANSNRCEECHAKQQDRAAELLHEND